MLSVQPVGFHHYSSLRSTLKPQLTRFPGERYFYASWEDGLWDLLLRYQVPHGSVVLVPSFFCVDVCNNMREHGLNPVFFPCDRHFQTPPATFVAALQTHKPSVVVILQAVGIQNKLFNQVKAWQHALPHNCLLIEDCVHRILDPSQISYINNRHFLMDSLRKVVPLPGSNLFCQSKLPPHSKQPTKPWRYTSSVFGWWLVFQAGLGLSRLPFLPSVIKKTVLKWAEWAMIQGYDVIGDSGPPGSGWYIFKKLAEHLDFTDIRKCKTTQVEQYLTGLTSLEQDPCFFFINIPENDYGELRGFPLGLELAQADRVLTNLRNCGLLVRFELNACPWSQEQKVVYLPLGPYLSEKQIDWVIGAVLEAVKHI